MSEWKEPTGLREWLKSNEVIAQRNGGGCMYSIESMGCIPMGCEPMKCKKCVCSSNKPDMRIFGYLVLGLIAESSCYFDYFFWVWCYV